MFVSPREKQDRLAKASRLALATIFITVCITQTSSAQPPVAAGITTDQVLLASVQKEKNNKQHASRSKKLVSQSGKYAGLKKLTDNQLIEVLKSVGFKGNSLRTAWAIVKRESGGRPVAFNGNRNTGDSSYGLFQINMIGDLGPSRRATFGLKSNNELFNPYTNARAAYHMSAGGRNWSAWDIDSNGYNGGVHRSSFLKWLAKYPK